MKRYASARLLAILALGLLLTFGCSPKAADAPKLSNSNGNLINMGMTAADGDWIYFPNASKDGQLWKMKRDGSGETLISEDQAAFLNVTGGSIYYANGKDGSRVYRIKPDGSERTLVSDYPSNYLISDGQWLYAIDATYPEVAGKTGRIYRCKLDGSERTLVGEATAAQLNLAGDFIYYTGLTDKALHRMKTDGTGDQVIGTIKPMMFIVSGEKIYYIDGSSEAQQIWSAGLDGTGAVKLTDDKAAPFNISGDWIWYSHPKEEMMTFEFKKMKLDGSEPTVVNNDMPMVLTIHDDLLAYLQMDLASFSMSQVFVKTDGTGRKEFKLTPENTIPEPGEDPTGEGVKTYEKNELIAGHGMTVMVERLYATNLPGTDPDEMTRFFHSKMDDNIMIIRFNVTNDGEGPLELYMRVGIMAKNSKDGGEYTALTRLADVTDLVAAGKPTESLSESQYKDSLIIQPGDTRIIQAWGSLDVRSFPVNFTLFDDQMPYASVPLEPDVQAFALKSDAALQLLQRWFVGRDIEVTALEPYLTENGPELQLFYPFTAKGADDKVDYYLVDGFTREIYTGEKTGDRILPLEIVAEPPEEEPPVEEPTGEPVTWETGETVEARDMTVVVNSVYGTDVRKLLSGEPIESKRDVATYLFVTFTVTSKSDIPLELEDRFGILEIRKDNGGTTETGWNVSLADITDRTEEISRDHYLPPQEYNRSLIIKPGQTRMIQAECGIEGRDFPVLFTLRAESGKEFAYIRITPDPLELSKE